MTRDTAFKTRVRDRMAATGEPYAAARRALLATDDAAVARLRRVHDHRAETAAAARIGDTGDTWDDLYHTDMPDPVDDDWLVEMLVTLGEDDAAAAIRLGYRRPDRAATARTALAEHGLQLSDLSGHGVDLDGRRRPLVSAHDDGAVDDGSLPLLVRLHGGRDGGPVRQLLDARLLPLARRLLLERTLQALVAARPERDDWWAMIDGEPADLLPATRDDTVETVDFATEPVPLLGVDGSPTHAWLSDPARVAFPDADEAARIVAETTAELVDTHGPLVAAQVDVAHDWAMAVWMESSEGPLADDEQLADEALDRLRAHYGS